MLLVLAWILLALGVAYRAWGSYAAIRTAVALRRLVDEPDAGVDSPVPSTSVVVAARDEASTFRHEAAVLEALDHPDLELVLVDDRSADATGRIMEQLAADDPRVRVVHVTELPEGWLGKVHALEQGRRVARGEWLLFTDADVELAPDLPRRAVQFAERHALDALALLPSVRSSGVLVAGVVGTFSRWLVVGTRLWHAADPDRPEAFGVGACNLVRASALEAAGGFEWLRMDVADDAALAQHVAAGGGRTMLASGVDLLAVRWQESVRGMARGFEKYGGTGGVGSPAAAVVVVSLALLGELAPWLAMLVAVVAGAAQPIAVAVAVLLASGAVAVAATDRAGAPLLGLLAGPLAPLLVWWMQVRAAWLEHRRGGVVWRDTFYSTSQLRDGKRYRLPGVGRRSRQRGRATRPYE